MPFADLPTDARLFYEHLNPQSDKIPVVLIHGLLGTGRKDLGHIMDWLVNEGYEVYAPSLRGYGESTPKPRDFPYGFYNRDADDILAFLEQLNLDHVHLLGYSDGGEVALIAAGTQPQRFASVATIGSTGFFDEQVKRVVQGYRPGSQWITEQEIAMHNIADADDFSRQWQEATIQLVDNGGDVARRFAPQLTMPLLLMLGERDSLNPRHNAQMLIDGGATNASIKMFDSGHPIHDEQTDEFKTAFLNHLQAAEA